MPHGASHFHIVGPDEGRVFVGFYLPVEEDDRDAGVKGFFHSRHDGDGLVGGNNQQVHPLVHEFPNLLHLAPAVVIGR